MNAISIPFVSSVSFVSNLREKFIAWLASKLTPEFIQAVASKQIHEAMDVDDEDVYLEWQDYFQGNIFPNVAIHSCGEGIGSDEAVYLLETVANDDKDFQFAIKDVASRVLRSSELAEAAGDDACWKFLQSRDFIVLNDISEAQEACENGGLRVIDNDEDFLWQMKVDDVATYLKEEHGYLCFNGKDELATFISDLI
jgi:hypothetical protein